MTTRLGPDSRPIERMALPSARFDLLMLGASMFLFIQVANGGGLLYLDNGLAVEPRDAAFALQFLAVLLLPHLLVRGWQRPARQRLMRWLAFPCSALLLLAYPLPMEARLWSEACHVDGTPMYSEPGGDRVKSWDAFFGYVPAWKAHFAPTDAWARYEGNDAGERHTYVSNGWWGKRVAYALNRNAFDTSPDGAGNDGVSDKVHECATETTVHVLGFYWRDRRQSDVVYRPAAQLPQGLCRVIDMPDIGADFR